MNPEDQDEFKEFDAFLNKHKKPILLTLAATALALTSYAGISYSNFQDFVKEHPPQGKIAYSVDNEIRYLNATDIINDLSPSRLQTPSDIEDLLWLNNSEIVFVSNTFDEPSHHVYKTNIKTGDITELFNPYAESSKPFFGDVAKKELETAKQYVKDRNELEKQKEAKEIKGYVIFGYGPTIIINDLGVDNNQVYFKISNNWYTINKTLEKPTLLPRNLTTNQVKGPNDNYTLIDTLFNSRLIKAGSPYGFDLESSADNPAWSPQ